MPNLLFVARNFDPEVAELPVARRNVEHTSALMDGLLNASQHPRNNGDRPCRAAQRRRSAVTLSREELA
jgi:hypothetical protein